MDSFVGGRPRKSVHRCFMLARSYDMHVGYIRFFHNELSRYRRLPYGVRRRALCLLRAIFCPRVDVGHMAWAGNTVSESVFANSYRPRLPFQLVPRVVGMVAPDSQLRKIYTTGTRVARMEPTFFDALRGGQPSMKFDVTGISLYAGR